MNKRCASFDIWKTIFQDDEAFMELFFSTLYHDENTLLVQNVHTEDADAHLQFLPYRLCIKNKLYSAYYVCGVATRPEVRNRGYARQLLNTAHYRMWLKGATFSFLIPQEDWLYQYYNRVAQYLPLGERAQLENVQGAPFDQDASSAAYKHFSALRNKALLTPHVAPDFLQWRVALQTAIMSNGGYLLDTKQGMEVLYEQIGDTFVAPVPTDLNRAKNAYGCGMVRLINPYKLLKAYAEEHVNTSLHFWLVDEALPMNGGLYMMENGMVRFFRPNSKLSLKYSILRAFEQEEKKRGGYNLDKNQNTRFFTPESLLLFLIEGKRFFFDQLMDGLKF